MQCAGLREYFWVCMSWERFDYVSRQNITRFKTKRKRFKRRNISSKKRVNYTDNAEEILKKKK